MAGYVAPPPRSYAFANGKAGVGKTSCAANTAVAMADDYGQLTGEIFTRTVAAEQTAEDVAGAR